MARRGPRTPEGRAISSRNAERHGLYSDAPVVAGETLEGWQQFHDGVVESLAPQGALEAELAGRVASLLWRLRRVAPAEANLIARHHLRGDDPANPDACYASALPVPVPPEPPPLDIPDVRFLATIIRHEARLDRQFRRALHQLQALQDWRQRQRIPLDPSMFTASRKHEK